MAEIWNYFKNLFNQAEESSPSKPLIHEVIERTEAEKLDFEHWKKTLVSRRLLDWLNDQFAVYTLRPNDIDEALDFLDTPSSKGFVIYFYKTRYSDRDVTFLLDHLKERVLEQGYKVQVSDARTYQTEDWVEKVERHYLKPRQSIKTKEEPDITYGHPTTPRGRKSNQEFGNITIELLFRNDKAHHLKFRANSYRDHKFEDAREFEELMQLILI